MVYGVGQVFTTDGNISAGFTELMLVDTAVVGRAEPAGVREEMLELRVQFKDATLVDKITPAVKSALSCKKNCKVNPINTLHKIRDAFYALSKDGEITGDESTMLVARMMKAAGDTRVGRSNVVQQLSQSDFSALRL